MKAWLVLGLLRMVDVGGCAGQVTAASAANHSIYGLAARTTGAIEAVVTRDDDIPSLGSPRSHGPGFEGWFAITGNDLSRAELTIAGVRGGETGADYPARLRLVAGARAYESADCTATVVEQTPQMPTRGRATGQSFVVVGSLRCASALRDPEREAPGLSVAQFDFALPVAWD